MTRFVARPIEIEAHQWRVNGDHPKDYDQDEHGFLNGVMQIIPAAYRREHFWEGHIVRYFRHPEIPGHQRCAECGFTMHEHGWLDTPPVGKTVCPGDWIIEEPDGSGYYPCKPTAMEARWKMLADPT